MNRFAFLLAFGLVACGDPSVPSIDDPDTTPPVEQPDVGTEEDSSPPNSAPEVALEAPETAHRASAVALEAVASDADGDDLEWTWEVSDGQVEWTGGRAVVTTPDTPGNVTVTVSVTDGQASATARVSVAVENRPPSVAVAAPEPVARGEEVTLSAQGEDADGDPLRYEWTQLGGGQVALDEPTNATIRFTAPSASGDVTFSVTAHDGHDASTPATVVVSVTNAPPVADGSAPDIVNKRASFALDAASSADPDGDDLTFVWTQLAGPDVEIEDRGQTALVIAPTVSGPLRFSVVVSDGEHSSPAVELETLVVNRAPEVSAPEQVEVAQGAAATLEVDVDEPDEDSYELVWTQTEGTPVSLMGEDTERPWFEAPREPGSLGFRATVTDVEGASDAVDVVVNVRNEAPSVRAEAPAIVRKGQRVELSATATDPGGDPLSVTWTQVEGAPVSLEGAETLTPAFVAPTTSGQLAFSVRARDPWGAEDAATVRLLVENRRPVAEASATGPFRHGLTIALDGTGSSDPDGDPLGYAWRQIGGPEVTISDADALMASVQLSGIGSYEFRLTVTDADGAQAIADVLFDATNEPPVADAGEDLEVARDAAVTLDGSRSTDPDGGALTLRWSQLTGTAVDLAGADTANPSFVARGSADPLTFELAVSDGLVESTDTVVVTVANHVPLAVLTSPPTECRPGERVVFDGRDSFDDDGDELSYRWRLDGINAQFEGPSDEATITAACASRPGTFSVSLEVFDGFALSDTVRAQVELRNDPPVADAGADQVANAGSEVTLDGSASVDHEGDRVTFRWAQVDGPEVELRDARQPVATFVMVDAAVTLRLTVSDPYGSASDTVIIAPNRPPVADAGADVYFRRSFATTAQLNGSASFDPEGGSLTYSWRQIGGIDPPAQISGANTPRPEISFQSYQSRFEFRLTVTDESGLSSTDTVEVIGVWWSGQRAAVPQRPDHDGANPHLVGRIRCEGGDIPSRIERDEQRLYLSCPHVEVWNFEDPVNPVLVGTNPLIPEGRFCAGSYLRWSSEEVVGVDVRDPSNVMTADWQRGVDRQFVSLDVADGLAAAVESGPESNFIRTFDCARGIRNNPTGADYLPPDVDRVYSVRVLGGNAVVDLSRGGIGRQLIGYNIAFFFRRVPFVSWISLGSNILSEGDLAFSVLNGELAQLPTDWPPRIGHAIEPPAVPVAVVTEERLIARGDGEALLYLVSDRGAALYPVARMGINPTASLDGLVIDTDGQLLDIDPIGDLEVGPYFVPRDGTTSYQITGLSAEELPVCDVSGGTCAIRDFDPGLGTAQVVWTLPDEEIDLELVVAAGNTHGVYTLGRRQVAVR